ncbi:MAG: hypothetical protein AVDCRST_MAG22-3097, partial [uncultured Rubrobacteraceae bacterium]
ERDPDRAPLLECPRLRPCQGARALRRGLYRPGRREGPWSL